MNISMVYPHIMCVSAAGGIQMQCDYEGEYAHATEPLDLTPLELKDLDKPEISLSYR